MKMLPKSDFRASRLMLEDSDFALTPEKYPGPTSLIKKGKWKSIVSLPDDVSIRTSDKFGPQLEQMWKYWDIWGRVVLEVQSFSKDPTESPTAIAACDAADEFQGATYCALVGFYRVAFSCLRNVLEQMTIATRLALVPDPKFFVDWRNGSEKIGFGWAADTITKSPDVGALETHLMAATTDSLFAQNPKGLARRLFAELSKYTHGAAGFTDADSRESNGPIFVPKAFLTWRVAALKTCAIKLHELKLAHPQLKSLPYGPPRITFDQFRCRVLRQIPSTEKDRPIFESLGKVLALSRCCEAGRWQNAERNASTRTKCGKPRSFTGEKRTNAPKQELISWRSWLGVVSSKRCSASLTSWKTGDRRTAATT